MPVSTDRLPGQRDRGTVGRVLATVVSDVFSPAVVVIALPIAVAWQATGGHVWPALGWGMLVALFSSILPMAFILRGARQGRWDGRHVRNREGRLLPLSLGLASTAVGLAILLVAHAPRDMVALDVAMLGTLFVCLVITRWWKISLHAAVAAGATAVLTLLYGPVLLVLIAVVAVVAWSRVKLTDHTIAQVIAGALAGPVVGGVIFLAIR